MTCESAGAQTLPDFAWERGEVLISSPPLQFATHTNCQSTSLPRHRSPSQDTFESLKDLRAWGSPCLQFLLVLSIVKRKSLHVSSDHAVQMDTNYLSCFIHNFSPGSIGYREYSLIRSNPFSGDVFLEAVRNLLRDEDDFPFLAALGSSESELSVLNVKGC